MALAAVAFTGVGCGSGSHTAGPAAADVSGTTTEGASTATTATGTAAGGASHTTTATDTTTSSHTDQTSTGQPQSKPGSGSVDAGKYKPKSKVKAGSGGAGSTGVGSATTVSSVSTSISTSSSSGNAPNANTGVPYEVSTSSMEPTFQPETTVYYDPTRTTPQLGEVIVFYLPAGAKGGACGDDMTDGQACAQPLPGLTHELAMKRVVGLPGDTIAIRGGRIIRNGQPESEPPITPCGEQEMVGCEFPNPITVPAGHYYVMSDYRGLYQEDSRVFGAIPQEAIVGTVEQP